jgi:isopenicillin-N N-acyltransferase-like protein
MDRPVAMKSNLHSVLFETTTGKLWVANATMDGQPAALQPYHAFDIQSLLKQQPASSAPSLPVPPASDSKAEQAPPAATVR